jgi:serine/threonine protein kinase
MTLLLHNSHPNIISLLDVVRTPDKLVLVFPYQKYSLASVVRSTAREGLAPATAQWYIFQLLRAVKFLHERNVMHRDIKPENILVGEVRETLVDCGTAA